MFQKVINSKGFWQSVLALGVSFCIIFVLIKWAIEQFRMAFFSELQNPILFIVGLVVGGFLYGFIVTFGKFKTKLKEIESKK